MAQTIMVSDLARKVIAASAEEKLEVYHALKAFFSLRGKVAPLREIVRHRSGAPIVSIVQPDMSDEHLYITAICHQMEARGLSYVGHDRLRKSRAWSVFYNEKVVNLNKFFAREKFSRTEKIALLNMGVGLIIDGLRHHRIPATASNIMLNYDRMPALIDREFPGYAEQGLLRAIFRMRRKKL